MSFGALSGAALRRAQRGRARRRLRARHRRGRPDRVPPQGRRRPDLGAGQRVLRRAHPGRRLRRARVRDKAAHAHVKLVSLKLSQGAKPGIGGQLPGSKVTKEIAEARDVPQGEPCVSPAAHTRSHTPRELVRFIAHMRELAGGKPAGFKLCVGSPARAAGDLQGDARGGDHAGLHHRRRRRGRDRRGADGVRRPRRHAADRRPDDRAQRAGRAPACATGSSSARAARSRPARTSSSASRRAPTTPTPRGR